VSNFVHMYRRFGGPCCLRVHWKLRSRVPPKPWYLYARLHRGINHETVIPIFAILRTMGLRIGLATEWDGNGWTVMMSQHEPIGSQDLSWISIWIVVLPDCVLVSLLFRWKSVGRRGILLWKYAYISAVATDDCGRESYASTQSYFPL